MKTNEMNTPTTIQDLIVQLHHHCHAISHLATDRSLHDFIGLENEHPGWHIALQSITAQAISLNSQITLFDEELI